MTVPNEIRFVNFNGPGQECNAADARITRQHVRRAVMRKRKTGDMDDRIKHFDGTTLLGGFATQRASNDRLISTMARKGSSEQNHRHVSVRMLHTSSGGSVGFHDVRTPNLLIPGLAIQHPYTAYAALCVDIPVSRIDSLFKSRMTTSSISYRFYLADTQQMHTAMLQSHSSIRTTSIRISAWMPCFQDA